MHIFFFNDTATTEIYTLSLHDALPISGSPAHARPQGRAPVAGSPRRRPAPGDLAGRPGDGEHAALVDVRCVRRGPAPAAGPVGGQPARATPAACPARAAPGLRRLRPSPAADARRRRGAAPRRRGRADLAR